MKVLNVATLLFVVVPAMAMPIEVVGKVTGRNLNKREPNPTAGNGGLPVLGGVPVLGGLVGTGADAVSDIAGRITGRDLNKREPNPTDGDGGLPVLGDVGELVESIGFGDDDKDRKTL